MTEGGTTPGVGTLGLDMTVTVSMYGKPFSIQNHPLYPGRELHWKQEVLILSQSCGKGAGGDLGQDLTT